MQFRFREMKIVEIKQTKGEKKRNKYENRRRYDRFGTIFAAIMVMQLQPKRTTSIEMCENTIFNVLEIASHGRRRTINGQQQRERTHRTIKMIEDNFLYD